MKHLFIFVLWSTVLGAAPSSQPADAENDTGPIRIGVTLSLSGKFEHESTEVRAGYDFWEKAINNSGGIRVNGGKRKVVLIYADDQSSPEISASATEKNLIQHNKVQFLFGPYSSELTTGVAKVARKYKLPLIASTASADSLFIKASRYVFGIVPPASKELDTTLETLQAAGAKSIAVMYTKDPFAERVAKSVPQLCTKHELTLTDLLDFPDFSPTVEQDPLKQVNAKNIFKKLLSQIKQKKPDVVIGVGHFYDSERFIWAMKELNFNPAAVVLTIGPALPIFLSRQGASASGIVSPVGWFPSLPYKDAFIGTAQEYAERFETEYGYKPTYLAAAATTAGIVLQSAIEQAQSVESSRVLEKLRVFSKETFFGPIHIDETGKNIGTPMVVLQVLDGKTAIVGPKKFEAKKLQYPKSSWPSTNE
jgi:branched-chain amino acid transport system substrate-binding protein